MVSYTKLDLEKILSKRVKRRELQEYECSVIEEFLNYINEQEKGLLE